MSFTVGGDLDGGGKLIFFCEDGDEQVKGRYLIYIGLGFYCVSSLYQCHRFTSFGPFIFQAQICMGSSSAQLTN